MRFRLPVVVAPFACAVSLAAACTRSSPLDPASPSDGRNASSLVDGVGPISLQRSDWEVVSNPSRLAVANDDAGRLVFDFPANGSMNYMYNVRPPQQITGEVVISLQVVTSGPVFFNWMTEPINTCGHPASVRPFFWANGNGSGEFDRWWSNPVGYDLAAGTATLVIEPTPDKWSSLFGKFGNQDATARAGFDRATRNVSRLGITFGGGCYFGHGVFVQNGQAKFVLESYRIGRPTS